MRKTSILLAAAAALTSVSASASTLALWGSVVSPDGMSIVYVTPDSTNVINSTAVPGSYDFSHTILAENVGMPLPIGAGIGEGGVNFADGWVFTISSPAIFNAVTSTISQGDTVGISNFSARLVGNKFSSEDAAGTPYDCGKDCSGSTAVLGNIALAPGTYALQIFGLEFGTVSGSYGGNFTLTAPVPVPTAVWLFGSALALLAGLRRKMATA